MAALRAVLIFFALAGFFLIGTPLQWVITRFAPGTGHRIPSLFCRSILWLLRVDLKIEGAGIADGPVLVVANHVSWIDIVALGAIKPFCFLAKSEVARWPVLSAFAKVQRTVFVDRARWRSIPTANLTMASRMSEGRAVLLFPEGTTVAASEPGPFRSSHFAAARDLLRTTRAHDAVAVQPVALLYSSSTAAWVGDDNLPAHVWRTLRAPRLVCRMTFTQPISYWRESNRKEIALRSREAIVRAIGSRRPSSACTPLAAPADLDEVRTATC